MLRLLWSIALVIGGPAFSSPSLSQPNVPFPGTAALGLGRGNTIWCGLEPGSSTFQRNGTSGPARITLPEINHVNYSSSLTVSHRLVGLAVLTFSSATGGTATFV